MLGPRWFNGGPQKSKLWPCLFFVTLLIFDDAPTFSAFCWLWAAITPVRKLLRPKRVVGHLLIGHLLPPIFGQLLPPILGQLLPLILGQLLILILGHLLPLFIKRESTSTTCPTTHPTSSRRPWTRPPSSIKPLGLCNDRIYLDTFKCMSVWNVA